MQERITIIYGMTGTGKTTMAKKIVDETDRVIIIDPLEEYTGLLFYTFEDLHYYLVSVNPKEFRCICRFSQDHDIDYIFKLAELIQNVLIVVEEAEIYISRQAQQNNSFLHVVRYGRHYNVALLCIARRVAELNINVRSMTKRIISFKQIEPKDLIYMKNLGIEGVENLPDFDFSKGNLSECYIEKIM